jgi:hypothetical protein
MEIHRRGKALCGAAFQASKHQWDASPAPALAALTGPRL